MFVRLTAGLVALCVFLAGSTSAPQLEVFVLAGQSNMAGRGQPLSDGASPDPSLLLWRGGAWQQAVDPLAPSSEQNRGVGPGMTFGLDVLDDEPGTIVGLVMCAVGGSSIGDWKPGGQLYRNCVSAARATGGQVKGILFLQGEEEADSAGAASNWETGFAKVRAGFESDLGPAPFLLGQIGTLDPQRFPAQATVRQAQADAAAGLPGVTLVTSSDLPVYDGVHFTAQAQLVLGSRFGNAFAALAGKVMITSFAPAEAAAGTEVTIRGLNLGGSNLEVKFNGSPAAIVSQSENQVVALVPPQASSGQITVKTSAGLSGSKLPFDPLPQLTAVSPAPARAGNVLTITGTNLVGASGLTLGKTTLGIASVDSPTQITTTPLPASAVTGDLTVTTPGGTSADLQVGVLPTIASLSAVSGTVGSTVTITGGGFYVMSTVRFNGTPAKFKASSATSLQAWVPQQATTGPISVTNSTGTTSDGSFAVLPKVSKFSPGSGSAGTSVSIMGSGLTETTGVVFGGASATISSVTATRIVAVVPAAAVLGPITVVTPSGSAATKVFKALAKVTAVSPSPAKAGNTLTITGTNLLGATSVELGGFSLPITSNTATQVKAGPVPADAYTAKLLVATAAGRSNTITLLVAPTVTSFEPSAGSAGTTITLHGTGLKGTQLIQVAGVKAKFSVPSPTELRVTVPSGASSGQITVTTSGGTATSATSFSVLP